MNVLMFVMTMLMIMTVLTYAKIESFRTATGLHIQFENYMQHMERNYINQEAEKQYGALHLKRENGSNGKVQSPRSGALATLPIGVLLNVSPEVKAGEEYQYTAAVLKGLIYRLYGDYDFFKEAQLERPEIVDDILIRLTPAVQEMGSAFKVNKAKDLANIDLGDPLINEVFYRMLRGSQVTYEDAKGNIIEEGYPSLLKYINSKKGKKVRVYLAPKLLLQVLFDPLTAEEIVTTREYFYREVKNGNMEAADATERFESMFVTKVNPMVPVKNLDFSVSKTDPKGYRE